MKRFLMPRRNCTQLRIHFFIFFLLVIVLALFVIEPYFEGCITEYYKDSTAIIIDIGGPLNIDQRVHHFETFSSSETSNLPEDVDLIPYVATTIIRIRDKAVVNLPVIEHTFKHFFVLNDYYTQAVINNVPQDLFFKFFHLGHDLAAVGKNTPLLSVVTPYIFVPLELPQTIPPTEVQQMIDFLVMNDLDLIIIPFDGRGKISCSRMRYDRLNWRLERKTIPCTSTFHSVNGSFAIFGTTKNFNRIPNPWRKPFPEALFIQAAVLGFSIRMYTEAPLTPGRQQSFLDPGMNKIERYHLYDEYKIKEELMDNKTENYGCSRNSARCFKSIEDSTPDYLFEGRWTPPCCLRVLRETAKYVFDYLDKNHVRYWLEGGSLLGAVRAGDIIPWDYDVDIGVYAEDFYNVPIIKKLKEGIQRAPKKNHNFLSITDVMGYVWEPSRKDEGHFYRVQASTHNRLHVDIFPFYPKHGMMTKDTFMKTHPQDKSFPEYFLKPLTKISFGGFNASAPNNVRDFLEYKFGAGCIENPKYPNESILAYPYKRTSLYPTINPEW